MNIQSFRNRNGVVILVSIIAILLIYSIDLYKLNYQMKPWEQFGEIPIPANQIQYFTADTPDVVGYKEIESGEMVSCATTVVYVRTSADETYRCCDTGDRISCLARDFSSDIPTTDVECTNYLRGLLGVPDSLMNTKDYRVYGSCPSGASNLTVAQLDDTGQILWKTIKVNDIDLVSSALKCILVPLLLLLAIWSVVVTVRGKKSEPVRRF